ncbi:unnamed protein product [Mytilus coruscus]|uniref:Uncharacterized protein n=1 Tax=Mytilus coruscus TaxID=42192 RepID=A0A6J8C6F5_MYTCO|nr:unnamed protein product [Mytilus coruscus]
MVNLVQQKDLKSLVSNIVKKLLDHFEEKITSKFDSKVREATGKLHDKLDTLMIENEDLRERIGAKNKVINNIVEKVGDNNERSIDALRLANYNEQYSRKHNIRMLNFLEKRGENLRKAFIETVKSDLNVDIEPIDVLAIHRIPGKEGYQMPVIVKVKNTDTKIPIMRQKKSLKNEVKFHDDITQRNLGLMARLKNTKKFENVWFYNCNAYAKNETISKIKFDLFDNVEEKRKRDLKTEIK